MTNLLKHGTPRVTKCVTASKIRQSVLCAAGYTFGLAWFVLSPLPAWSTSVIAIPSASDPDYAVIKHDSSQPAPPGYEGRTDTSTEVAVGKTPATNGKTIKANFTLGNQIKTCPRTDGTAEGTGVFSMTIDYTYAQANGTSTTHIEMRADAKYKGHVGDDAFLHGPVNADIDCTYTQTGSFRDKSGAITNSPPSSIQQHITIQFLVSPSGDFPSFGAFSGGDPTQAHYAEAYKVGTALTYWAGIYYSVAQTKWVGGENLGGGMSTTGGQCVQIVFDPPSNTLQPPLGTQVKVNAKLRTRAGEDVKAKFAGAEAYYPGSVSPTAGPSDPVSAMQFTYTAPNQKVKKAGFHAIATSRAGASPEAEWLTGLGSGWSGEIYYEQQYTGDVGTFPDQQWSNSSLVTITVTIVNGMANWHGHLEKKSSGTNWQPVFKGPHRLDTSDESEDFGDGTLPAAVQVSMNEASCTYSIQAGAFIGPDGKSPWFVNGKAAKIGEGRWTQCNRTIGCKSGSHDLGMPSLPPLSPMSGKCTDPNHISASYSNRKEQLGDSKNGVMVETMSVNLSRSGTK